MNNLVLGHERVDDLLVNGLKIIQDPRCFRFGSDSVELANFAPVKESDVAFDLGCGTGVIMLLLAGKRGAKHCVGVEIQPIIADMARRSVLLNDLADRCTVIETPLQLLPKFYPPNAASLVVCNPPYRKKEGGYPMENESLAIARTETAVKFHEIVECAKYLLATKGTFCFVHRADRLAETMSVCAENGLEPKVLQLLRPGESKPPHLMLLQCVKGGRQGIKILPERTVDAPV